MPRGEIKKAVLIYDGNCPVCGATVDWIRENARKGEFEYLPCQSTERVERFPPIREAVCMDAMQLVLPDGTVLAGERALPEILKRLKRYSSLSSFFKLPGTEGVSRSFYRWFADRRYHIADVLFPEGKKKSVRKKSTATKGVRKKKGR
jgi:predicted DCC family thiol-disulfide oxidoreductase YuxK